MVTININYDRDGIF